MAKQQNNNPITAADIKEFAGSQDDFRFELEVLSLAKGLGLTAEHAGTYEDPVTNKPRQFDIRAFKDIGNHRIQLAIECKGINPVVAPLVLSRAPRPNEDSTHTVIESSTELTFHPTAHLITGYKSIYQPEQHVGKSMRQMKRDGEGKLVGTDSDVFDKWMQAIASSAELLRDEVTRLTPRWGTAQYCFVMPILVVSDSSLWAIDYSSTGAEIKEPYLIDEATFFVGRKISIPTRPLSAPVEYGVTHLHIFTRSKVRSFLEEVAKPGPLWQTIFSI